MSKRTFKITHPAGINTTGTLDEETGVIQTPTFAIFLERAETAGYLITEIGLPTPSVAEDEVSMPDLDFLELTIPDATEPETDLSESKPKRRRTSKNVL